jgi:molybdopterin synthase catalytic subunit
MTTTPTIGVFVRAEPFDVARETTAATTGLADLGAVVTFLGVCRSEAGRLAALEIEHYPGMAETEIRRIAEEAAARWSLLALSVIHRSGVVPVGEPIVVGVTASVHRTDAFKAAEFLMDFLKTNAPFWKKELAANGEPDRWVEAKSSDEAKIRHWQAP